MGHRVTGTGLGQLPTEHGIDQGAFSDARFPGDDDVHFAYSPHGIFDGVVDLILNGGCCCFHGVYLLFVVVEGMEPGGYAVKQGVGCGSGVGSLGGWYIATTLMDRRLMA
ncbi:hypothetical protein GCM10011247_28600 [Pseudomonas plecoglossicida]|nr:hypothetical protein GCM10011247_28600 [Pseudomonas plecoglossicida]